MLLTNIIAYYKLDESSGNATDVVGSYTLTNNNTVGYASAKINNGADFGASNSTKYLSTSNNLGIDGGAITMSCWVKVTTAPSNAIHTILAQGGASSDVQYKIEYRDSGGTKSVRFRRDRVGTSNQGSDYAYDLGTSNYHHLVLTYDNTNLKAYIDGVLVDTVACSGNGSSSTGFFNIGRDDGSSYFSGLVDEVGIWNEALTLHQVKVLYRAGNGVQYPFNVIEFGNTSGNGSQGNTSWSHNNDGDFLLVALNETSNGAVGVTYDGVAMTQIGTTQTNTFSTRYISLWGLVNPPTGTHTISVSGTANVNGGAVSANNVDQTTPYTGTTTAGATSSTASVSVTTTVDNAYVIGLFFVRDFSSNGSNTTTLINTQGQAICGICSTTDVVTPAGSSALTINTTGNEWNFIGTGLNPATTLQTITLTEELSLTATCIKSQSRVFIENLKLTNVFASLRIIPATLSEVVRLTDTFLGKITSRVLTETLRLTSSMIRSMSHTLSETLALTDVFISVTTLGRVLTENLRLTASLVKTSSRLFVENLKVTATFFPITGKMLTENLRLTSSMLRSIGKLCRETIRVSNPFDVVITIFGIKRKGYIKTTKSGVAGISGTAKSIGTIKSGAVGQTGTRD